MPHLCAGSQKVNHVRKSEMAITREGYKLSVGGKRNFRNLLNTMEIITVSFKLIILSVLTRKKAYEVIYVNFITQ